MTRRKLLAAGAACASTLWARSHWDRMRISAITGEIGKTPDDAADFARQSGLLFVEMRNIPGTAKEYWDARDADIQAGSTHLANEGVKISCLHCSLLRFAWPGDGTAGDQARWDRRMDDLQKALRCAQILRTDKLRILAGVRTADPSAMLQRTADAVGEMAAEADRQKVSLMLGNDAATNVATCAEMAAVMKLVPSKALWLDWNPHAPSRLEKPFPVGYALLPRKRILNVRAPAASLVPGAESEDWKAILVALDKDGYAGKIALVTDAAGSPDTAAARDGLDQLVHIIREVS